MYPGHNGHSLADHTVDPDDTFPNPSIDAFLEMELQVYAHSNLDDKHEHDIGDEFGVDIFGELPALVSMTEEVTNNSEKRS